MTCFLQCSYLIPWKWAACCWNALEEGKCQIKILLVHPTFLSVFHNICWEIQCQYHPSERTITSSGNFRWYLMMKNMQSMPTSSTKINCDGWLKVCYLRTVFEWNLHYKYISAYHGAFLFVLLHFFASVSHMGKGQLLHQLMMLCKQWL